MTEYQKKNGEFACFKKVSKKGTPYYNGTLNLDGKEYWVSIFSKKSQKGENYVSGIVEPKQPKQEPQNVDPGWETPPETNGWDAETNEFKDGIPF